MTISRALPATYAWTKALRSCIFNGHPVSPRGLDVHEVLGLQSIIDMRYPIVRNEARKLGYKFMAAEAYWIISGQNGLHGIDRYSMGIKAFSDDGLFFNGAYGPKVIDQIPYVLQSLMSDNSTRQAVLNIWREKPGLSKDIPCTLSAQWLIRNNKLQCILTMRSSDIWLGFPYDVFNFAMLSYYIIACLKAIDADAYETLDIGDLFLTAGSQHLYQTNSAKAREAIAEFDSTVVQPYAGNYDGTLVGDDLNVNLNTNMESPVRFLATLQVARDYQSGALGL